MEGAFMEEHAHMHAHAPVSWELRATLPPRNGIFLKSWLVAKGKLVVKRWKKQGQTTIWKKPDLEIFIWMIDFYKHRPNRIYELNIIIWFLDFRKSSMIFMFLLLHLRNLFMKNKKTRELFIADWDLWTLMPLCKLCTVQPSPRFSILFLNSVHQPQPLEVACLRNN